MTRLVSKDHNVLIGSLSTIPKVQRLFNFHKCDGMDQDLNSYNEEIVQEFYISTIAILRGSIDERAKSAKKDPLTSMILWGCRVDNSATTMNNFQYGSSTLTQWTRNTQEFDYSWEIFQSGTFQRNAEQCETLKKLLTRYIATDGERVDGVIEPQRLIKRSSLKFLSMFFWLLFQHLLSPTKGKNLHNSDMQ